MKAKVKAGVVALLICLFGGQAMAALSAEASLPLDPCHKVISRTYIRFSVVTGANSHAWLATKSTSKGSYPSREAALKAIILDPHRLDTRFTLFEQVCLPGLKGMIIPEGLDHKFVLLTSKGMDKTYIGRLQGLIADCPDRFQIIPCGYQEDFIHKANEALFSDIKTGNHTHIFSTRLDDDDTLAPNFLQALLEDAATINWSGFITYPQGMFIHMTEGSEAQYGLGYRWENGAAGITMVSPIEGDRPKRRPNIFQHGNHLAIKTKAFERPLMFLRLGHSTNDQGDLSRKKELMGFQKATDRHLPYEWIQSRFGITLPKAESYNSPT